VAVEIEGAVGGETITVVSVGEINDVVVLAVVLVVVDVDGTVEVVVDDRGGGASWSWSLQASSLLSTARS